MDWLIAALLGLVQGLTEFLPVSSSGHLRIVPDAFGIDPPDLATTAVLHLGTLIAVVAYYRNDLLWIARNLRTEPLARRLVALLMLGTIPAVVLGFLFEDRVERLQESSTAVGLALIFTGFVLMAGDKLDRGGKVAERSSPLDAILIGLAQAVALIPGVSRSGMTISAGSGRGLDRRESARFAFLLSIPVILGGGLLQLLEVADQGGLRADLLIGVVVAAVVGYAAIAFLINGLARWGMRPFVVYCLSVGLLSIIAL